MTNPEIQRCVEQIRIAFNSSPNVRRRKSPLPIQKPVQTLVQMKKSLKNEFTGYYGLFSPRSKRFVFGIQEESQAAVGEKAQKRLDKRWKHNFEMKRIRYRNAGDFNEGLKVKSDGCETVRKL